MTETLDEIRLDLCLYHLRFCKTRPLAQALIEKGRVRINGERATKPARKVRIGDVLVFPAHDKIHSIRLTGLPAKRVGASIAVTQYSVLENAPANP